MKNKTESSVFFADMRAEGESLLAKVGKLFKRARFSDFIEEGDFVAIKVHFGELGNTAYVSSVYIAKVVEAVKEARGKPFLTDANTLYVGKRSNAIDHIKTAIKNGFSFSQVGAPIIIADGLNGKDYAEVKIGRKHFDKVKIGSAVCYAGCLIAVSHFTGHEMTGFGATLKNVGMGLGSRSAKQMMHSDVLPVVDLKKCTGCKRCLRWCPQDAIELVSQREKIIAKINHKKCVGCGECVVACPIDAIVIGWEGKPDVIQEKIVEHVYGVLKDKKEKVGFFNFLINITPDCDCWEWSDAYVVSDIGVLASKDPVAIDQAACDLVNRTKGILNTRLFDPESQDKIKSLYPQVDWQVQLKYAEELKIGTRKYRLIKVK